MTALAAFHRVKSFDAWRKTAGITAPSHIRVGLCLQTWQQIKTAAAQDPQGLAAGLARLAILAWADQEQRGSKIAMARQTRDDYATSFAAAGAVDQAIDGLVKQGEITSEEAEKMHQANAIIAIGILEKISGIREQLLALVKNHPELVGAGVGTGIGAGLGAWKDDENRLRGALAGGLGGAAIGGLVGQGHRQATQPPLSSRIPKQATLRNLAWSKMSALEDPAQATQPQGGMPPQGPPQGQPPGAPQGAPQSPAQNPAQGGAAQGAQPGGLPTPENTTPGEPGAPEPLGQSPEEAMAQQAQQQEEQMAKEYQQHNSMVDNLSFLAQQVGLPSLAQEIEGTRPQLIQHFAAGNQYMPHNLQKYFPQSEHAKQFIEKFKARFAPITGGGGKGGGGGGGAKKAASELLDLGNFADRLHNRVSTHPDFQGEHNKPAMDYMQDLIAHLRKQQQQRMVQQKSAAKKWNGIEPKHLCDVHEKLETTESCPDCKCSHGKATNETCPHCKRFL